MELRIDCPPTYRPGAKMLILGEAPGEEEVAKGEGFVGRSGKLLDRLLTMAGLSRDEVSLSNVVKRRPEGNVFSAIPEAERLEWVVLLYDELMTHQPRVVVAVGNEALYALTGLREITKRRGSRYDIVLPLYRGELIPLVHPAALLRSQDYGEVVVATLCLQRASLLSEKEHVSRQWSEQIVDSQDGMEFIASLYDAKRWALDLETIPAKNNDGSIRCLGLAGLFDGGETRAVSIVWPDKEVWANLHTLLDRNANFIGHNLAYDMGWLQTVGIKPRIPYLDTMQGFHLLYPEMSKGLDFVTMYYLGLDIPYYKDEGKIYAKKKPTSQELQRYYEYNIKDCVATLWASECIEKELKQRGLWLHYCGWHRKNQEVALEMQSRPMLVDRVEAAKLAVALTEKVDAVREELHTLAGREVNPQSSKQVIALLKERGLPVPTKRGGKETTDEDALKLLYIRKPDEVLRRILDVRKISKANGQYVLPLVRSESLAFGHTSDATETFRYTAQAHPTGSGFNLQTVPKVLRYLYPAPTGRVFIQPDLSQAEARYVAQKSGCKGLLELFNDPTRNVHMERAKYIFGKTVEKDSPEYVLAKSSLHASNYREGPQRFSEQTGIPLKQSKEILAKSDAMYPEIRRWHDEVKYKLRKEGRLVNCWGMERQCFEALGAMVMLGTIPDPVWKDAIAWEPQSAIPQAINRAMHNLVEHRKNGLDIWFHQHGHDSFLASIPVEQTTPQTRELLLRYLNEPILMNGHKLTIPAELAIGYNWGMLYAWGEDTSREWWNERVEMDRAKGKGDTLEYVIKTLLFIGGLE